jgi:O-antigen/teichoic acid export membrane protein
MTLSEPQPLPLPRTVYSRITSVLRRRAFWVLIDQGIVSAGNFLAANLLARNLPKAGYGGFSGLFETIVFLNSLQAALVIYPLTIKGATGHGKNLGRLATASIVLTLCLLPILGGATVVSARAFSGWGIGTGAVVALIFWQIQETLRRALMADLRFAQTVGGDTISYVGQVACIAILAHLHKLTLNSALMAIGLTSAAAIVLQAVQVGLQRIPWSQIGEVAADFWKLSRWMLLSALVGAITGPSYWWTLNATHGAEACGVFAAIVLFFKLANPVMSSMSGLIIPSVARASKENNRTATRQALRYISFGALLLSPYFLALALAPRILMRLAYGSSSPYLQEAPLLQLFVLNATMGYFATVGNAWLAGLGRSDFTFRAQMCNVAATLLIGLPLTVLWSVSGMVIGGTIASCFGIAAYAYYIWKTIHAHK